MPVLDRVDWVARQVNMGRRVHIHVGRALKDYHCKVKILLEPAEAGAVDPVVAAALLSMLASVRQLVLTHCAVDRGHRHSSGVSEIAIWLSPQPEFAGVDLQGNGTHGGGDHPGQLRGWAPSQEGQSLATCSADADQTENHPDQTQQPPLERQLSPMGHSILEAPASASSASASLHTDAHKFAVGQQVSDESGRVGTVMGYDEYGGLMVSFDGQPSVVFPDRGAHLLKMLDKIKQLVKIRDKTLARPEPDHNMVGKVQKAISDLTDKYLDYGGHISHLPTMFDETTQRFVTSV